MYCAVLIFHVLVLRSFITGMMRRDTKPEFFLTDIIEKHVKIAQNNYGGSADNDDDVCEEMYGRPCNGQLAQIIAEYLKHVTVGVAIVVVAVPEGLPLAVMISLAYSV